MKNLAINNGEPILKQKFKEKWPIISEEDIKSVEELMKKRGNFVLWIGRKIKRIRRRNL